MSPSSERRDDGFTLVELVVAFGILMTLVVALLPQLLGGIQATDRSRVVTQAKALVTSELERMRNLPFHVEPNAGQYVDLFDRYYQDSTAPAAPVAASACLVEGRHVAPPAASAGYVTGSARCAWEPQPPFYRVVRTADGYAAKGIAPDPDLAGYVVVVATQFVDAGTPPVVQPARPGYDTRTVGRDAPATSQVRVTVTVLPSTPSTRRPVTSTTQIARSYQTTTRVRAAAASTALQAGTTTTDDTAVSVSGALTDLEASLVAGSRVEVAAAGLSASLGTGESGATTRASAVAPPDSAVPFSPSPGGQLTAAGCALVCWGGSRHSPGTWTPTTASGLPGIGTPDSPVEVALEAPSDPGDRALEVGAGPGAAYLRDLEVAQPLLRLRSGDFSPGIGSTCSVDSSGSGLRLSSGGWARTTALPTGGADACATARTAEVAVLPAGPSARPLVTVRLLSATARCQVTGTAHAASAALSFAVEVAYWDGTAYVPVRPDPADPGTDVFTESNGGQLPSPSTLMVGDRPLSTWIDSWSVARPGAGIVTTAAAGTARVEVPAVVNILTEPLRQRVVDGAGVVDEDGAEVVDERSTLAVTVGSLSCAAEDRR